MRQIQAAGHAETTPHLDTWSHGCCVVASAFQGTCVTFSSHNWSHRTLGSGAVGFHVGS